MYKTAMFGLGAMLALSLLAIHPDVRSSFLPTNSKSLESTTQERSPYIPDPHIPDPQSLAIIAPTVTPTSEPGTSNTSDNALNIDKPYSSGRDSTSKPDPVVASSLQPGTDSTDTAATSHEPAEPNTAVAQAAAFSAESTEEAPAEPTSAPTTPAMAPIALPSPTPDVAPAEPQTSQTDAPEAPHIHDDAPPATASEPATAQTEPAAETTPAEAIQSAPSHADVTSTCQVSAPPADATIGGPSLDPLYEKHCAARGVPIVASGQVSDVAFHRAWDIVAHMMEGIAYEAEIRDTMRRLGLRIGIIGVSQSTTELPEHRQLNAMFPDVDWDNRTRAIGATTQIPLLSVGEENLLCHRDDRWFGQNLLVHEFAHAIKNLGLDIVQPQVHADLVRAYEAARAAGLWANTYVISDVEEYWAEGVRLYFQMQPHPNTPGGQPYPANNRAELETYDPELYRIIYDIFGPKEHIATCS